jgi:putative tricarboxylic transport membrane protein
MDTYKKKELVVGAVMLCAGLFYLFLTMNLPRKGAIDASTVPYVLAVGLCLLGFLQLLGARKAIRPETEPDDDTPKAAADYPTVLKTLALIAIYIALLETVGFLIMTVLYLYAQFIVVTPRDQKIKHLSYVIIAVIASIAIYFTFRHGFDLMLPAGFLDL